MVLHYSIKHNDPPLSPDSLTHGITKIPVSRFFAPSVRFFGQYKHRSSSVNSKRAMASSAGLEAYNGQNGHLDTIFLSGRCPSRV